jgi:hypothetical protein
MQKRTTFNVGNAEMFRQLSEPQNVEGLEITTPVGFVLISDPVAQGFVSNLARPGGSTTGFATHGTGLLIR